MKTFIITATRKAEFIGENSTQADFIETFEYKMYCNCSCDDAKEHYETIHDAYEVIDICVKDSIKEVSSFSQLYPALHPDGQESGTVEGWILFEGRRLWVRKHWSNHFYCCFERKFESFFDKKENTHHFPKQVGTLERDESTRREIEVKNPQPHCTYFDFDLIFVPNAH